MAEKIFTNVRLGLKVDTLENWNNSSLILKRGEVAFATVAASEGTGLTEPVCMMKIGDGENTFSQLGFNFYAKASDVIAAAKSESALTEFVNNVIAGAGIATDEAMTALSGRVTTAEGKITALEGLVGDKKVSTQISEAIDALKLSETYAAKSHTHTKSEITDFAHSHAIADVTGLSDAIADAKKAGTDANTALETYKATNDAAVKANADAITAINAADTGILAQAKSYADGKDTAIAAAKKAGDDAQSTIDSYKTSNDTRVKAVEDSIGTVPSDKTVVEMISDAQTAATYNDTEVRGLISDNADAIAGVKTLVGDTAVATQISTAVGNAKTELKGSASDTDASATIAGAKKYADKLDAAMDTRVDALEAAVGEGGSVATQIKTAIEALDVEDAAESGKYVSAVSETDGKITVTRAALPDYTNTYAAKTHTHEIANVTGLQAALDAKAADADLTTLEGKVTTLIGSDADKSVRTIANEELAAQLIPEAAKESLDTLGEIAAWIQAHPDDASAMNSAIEALQTKVGDTSVSAQITTAINELKNGDIKSATDRIATLEGKSHEHSNKALLDTYTQTEANLADAVAKKHSHANATELAKFADGDKAKLDSAVQTVTAGTGLTATKTGTNVAIGFDDTVTFVFDCGTASAVI